MARRAATFATAELRAAGLLDLGNAPVVGAGGAESHDEGDGGPQVVDQGAANLRVRAEGLQKGWPLALHGTEVRLADDLLVELRRARRGGAAGAGEGAPALEGVEVLALREGEERLVAEGGGGGVVFEVGVIRGG